MATATKTKKRVSVRDRYRELKQQNAQRLLSEPPAEDEVLYDFTLPTGLEVKLRRPNMQVCFDAGIMPQGLVAKFIELKKDGKTEEEMSAALTPLEKLQAMRFDAAVVRYCFVDPRIVENPTADDELGFDDLTVGDVQAVSEWAMGGGAASRLGNFPKQGQKLASLGPDVPRVRAAAKPVNGDNGQGSGDDAGR